MPSPFPGMDPYLEDPHRWPGFHNKFVSELETALNDLLLPEYYAAIEERVYISTEDDPGRRTIIPDVRIHSAGTSASRRRPKASHAVAVLECEPVVIAVPIEEEVQEPYLTVIERRSKQVVTVIEMLSPTNKVLGSLGRDQYLAKRAAVLRSQTHWMEIDLLRTGAPVIARNHYPTCEYTIHISRVNDRGNITVWPIRLHQHLPRVTIPLKLDTADAELDLQPVFDTVYERSAYAIKLDYTDDPTPPLRPELAKWANKLLKQKKLRKA